jgi:hypothetical protein
MRIIDGNAIDQLAVAKEKIPDLLKTRYPTASLVVDGRVAVKDLE